MVCLFELLSLHLSYECDRRVLRLKRWASKVLERLGSRSIFSLISHIESDTEHFIRYPSERVRNSKWNILFLS